MVAVWTGLLVLAFNVLGGAVLPVRDATASPSPLARLLDNGRIVVCTATGMVVMDADGTILPDDSGTVAPSHDVLCAYCLPLLHGSAAMAAGLGGISASPPVPTVLISTDKSVAPPARLPGSARARAPPTSILPLS